jgi:hypothetical protein
VEGIWVVGGIERKDDTIPRIFACSTEDRTKETLTQIIKNNVKKGSIIFTDCWKGYSDEELKNNGFLHDTVNHCYYFVDPVTFVHTNTIEGLWSGIKRNIPIQHRTKKFIDNDLFEYIWRRENKNNLWFCFLEAIKNVKYA